MEDGHVNQFLGYIQVDLADSLPGNVVFEMAVIQLKSS